MPATTNPVKKPVPACLSKKEFFNLCNTIPHRLLVESINEIIYENRKSQSLYKGKSREEIICTRTIFKTELIEFFETYGYPDSFDSE